MPSRSQMSALQFCRVRLLFDEAYSTEPVPVLLAPVSVLLVRKCSARRLGVRSVQCWKYQLAFEPASQ